MKERNSINFDKDLKELLDKEVRKRNVVGEVTRERLDPIFVAHKYKDPDISLICALFSYGNVKQIVKFLESLDFSLLEKSDDEIKSSLQNHYYRFQNSQDIIALFIALQRLKKHTGLEELFESGYMKNASVIDGVNMMIEHIRGAYHYESRGYRFLISQVTHKTKGAGALKRWMMFLRWMVRDDNIDMGLWDNKFQKNLIIPLDTHTFNTSKKLGLLQRKTYDLQAAIELTEVLRGFDGDDPLKYDFALYRLGQEQLV